MVIPASGVGRWAKARPSISACELKLDSMTSSAIAEAQRENITKQSIKRFNITKNLKVRNGSEEGPGDAWETRSLPMDATIAIAEIAVNNGIEFRYR